VLIRSVFVANVCDMTIKVFAVLQAGKPLNVLPFDRVLFAFCIWDKVHSRELYVLPKMVSSDMGIYRCRRFQVRSS